jgi:hypothetical protein
LFFNAFLEMLILCRLFGDVKLLEELERDLRDLDNRVDRLAARLGVEKERVWMMCAVYGFHFGLTTNTLLNVCKDVTDGLKYGPSMGGFLNGAARSNLTDSFILTTTKNGVTTLTGAVATNWTRGMAVLGNVISVGNLVINLVNGKSNQQSGNRAA